MSSVPPSLSTRALWLPACLLLAGYVLIAARSTLWDRDEPRYARATVEMLDSGDYLVPTFNRSLRPDKPAMIYWLMSAPVRVLGPTEIAFRLPAIVATLLAAGLTLLWGVRLGAPRAGAWAGLMLATSPLMMVSGTASTTDAVLLLCMLSALTAFHWLVRGRRPVVAVLLVGVALGAALLVKGPVGLVVPLLGMLTIGLWSCRSEVKARRLLWLIPAVAVGAGLFLLWALPANRATDGEFLAQGVGKHVVNRSLRPMESHGGQAVLFAFYYIPVILAAFFPWTLYLPAALVSLVRRRRENARAWRWLAGWFLPCFLLMSLVATKLPHYVLPCWPALALMCGLILERARAGDLSDLERRWLRHGVWFFAPVAAALGLGLIALPWIEPLPGLRPAAMGAGLIILAMSAHAARLQWRERFAAAGATLVGGMIALSLCLGLFLLPAIEPYKLSKPLAAAINEAVPDATVPVAMLGYTEPTLVLYLGRHHVERLPDMPAGTEWVHRHPRGVLVVRQKVLDEAQETLPPMETVARLRGYNYSKGKWMDVVALRSTLRPPEMEGRP